jgi:hypothetical protein
MIVLPSRSMTPVAIATSACWAPAGNGSPHVVKQMNNAPSNALDVHVVDLPCQARICMRPMD